ncbi:MAG: adenosylcobinamide-phosphate synthase CbiB [Treponema sp.]|jgi:adenosylcobinamide-phosphate synthase|nr:adenosylcobinamide-phosphate synthase CbiB [Treponema sp.]
METFKTACIIIAAFTLDCIIGDPQNPFHPMRLIGKGINLGIGAYRKASIRNPVVQFIAGLILSLIIIFLSYVVIKLLTWGFYRINYFIGMAVEAVICYFLIAAKALKDESMKVYSSLTAGDIEAARKNLSFIVGRDTQNLNQPSIVKAAVETVAENLSDGVIAPLIFILIGGAPLGMAYKAINTLDSMIGYRNDEFEYFGKFAARLDDIVNFIPSRISALLMLLGSVFNGMDTKMAFRIYIRDRYKHKSPNSAQTESVCAGALGLCLGGDNYYHGVLVHKPGIGDGIYEPEPKHIIAANRLMYSAAFCAVVLLAALSVAIAVLRGRIYV